MRTMWLIPLALPLLAAAPAQPLTLSVPSNNTTSLLQGTQSAPPGAARAPVYQPAPLPNRDLSAPGPGRASNEPSLAPTLFTSRTQYRGDGFSPGSTAQSVEENKLKPGAGISLHMPLTPQ